LTSFVKHEEGSSLLRNIEFDRQMVCAIRALSGWGSADGSVSNMQRCAA
jgi:hypothetical protein